MSTSRSSRSATPLPTIELVLRTVVILCGGVVLCTPLIVTPDAVPPHLAGKSALARSAIAVMTGVWVLLMVLAPRRYLPRLSWVSVVFGVYVAFALLATIFSVSPPLSFWSTYQRQLGVADLLHAFAFVLALVSVLQSERSWRALLSWGMAVVLAMEVVAIGEAFRLSFLGSLVVFGPRLGGTTGNPAFLAGLLATALPLATGLLAHSVSTKGLLGRGPEAGLTPLERGLRTLWVLVILLGVPVLFLTGTRGALVGLVAGAVAMLLVSPFWGGWPMARRLALPAGFLIGAVALTFGLYAAGIAPALSGAPEGVVTARIQGEEGSVEGAVSGLRERMALWQMGIRGFLDRPLLGYGPEGYAVPYDKHMDLDFVRDNGNTSNDKPHNMVVEELVGGGILGTGGYLALWLALVFVLLRRRRLSEGPITLGVLSALTAYFVQDLFLFDTPTSFWSWALLVAWVVGYELRARDAGREPEPAPAPAVRTRGKPKARARKRRQLTSAGLIPWALLPLAVLLAAGVGFAVTITSASPYRAAVAYKRVGDRGLPFTQRLDGAQRSFDSAPTSANTLRRGLIVDLGNAARDLPPEAQAKARAFVEEEAKRGLGAEPKDSRLLRAYIAYRQVTVKAAADLDVIDSLIQRLVELAPHKVTTQEVVVLQEILRGRPAKALELIDRYVAQAPVTANNFADLRHVAQAQLARGGGA